jgi:hypothetical protein
METTAAVSVDEIIAELDAPYSGNLPERALRAAQERREEITPRLIELIRKSAAAVLAGEPPEADGHLFALFLLAEFQAKESLPAILEAVSLPDEGPFELFGDAITENLSSVFAALTADTPEIVGELIRNESINEYVRWEAAKTYLHWVRDGRLTRDGAVQRLREHLQHAIATEDAELGNAIASELLEYSPHEAADEIREAFRLDLVEYGFIVPEDLEKSLAEGHARLRKSLDRCPPTGIPDAVEELSDWAAFQEDTFGGAPGRSSLSSSGRAGDWDPNLDDEPLVPPGTLRNTTPKVGRNDPCPCGSGRKYKKCCGAEM